MSAPKFRCWVHTVFDPNCGSCRKIEAKFTVNKDIEISIKPEAEVSSDQGRLKNVANWDRTQEVAKKKCADSRMAWGDGTCMDCGRKHRKSSAL